MHSQIEPHLTFYIDIILEKSFLVCVAYTPWRFFPLYLYKGWWKCQFLFSLDFKKTSENSLRISLQIKVQILKMKHAYLHVFAQMFYTRSSETVPKCTPSLHNFL